MKPQEELFQQTKKGQLTTNSPSLNFQLHGKVGNCETAFCFPRNSNQSIVFAKVVVAVVGVTVVVVGFYFQESQLKAGKRTFFIALKIGFCQIANLLLTVREAAAAAANGTRLGDCYGCFPPPLVMGGGREGVFGNSWNRAALRKVKIGQLVR